ncbi:hypothetical protein TIFTF001_009178 [Ficus carica]|uniref:Uncharacterized protein n=1 Tax=Ficus carica TaxID=3494 RepID=A0AA88CYQ1_FICCA|nr:hypothetical protein TIFTF001_009178 [Ficus carica]
MNIFIIIKISVVLSAQQASGATSLAAETRKMIDKANQNGPYLGLVIPNLFEMNPLINSPDYIPDDSTIDISDVAVPQHWSHTALWNWQRYGQGPGDELPLESNGDYTREIGYLKFASQTVNVTDCSNYDNLLNNIWYQPEEVFPIDGTPEQREHIFWVPVDSHYYSVAKTLQVLQLL